MLGIRGQYHLTMDAKGRLTLPSKLRDSMKVRGEEKLILTSHEDGLWGYLEEDWERFELQYTDVSPFDRERLDEVRAFIAGCHECELDKQGRVLIPPHLRDYAGLNDHKDAVLISVVNRVEIWSRERWNAVRTNALEALRKGSASASRSSS